MSTPTGDLQHRFDEILDHDSNEALHFGSRCGAAFGLFGAVCMLIGHLAGMPGNLLIPGIWALFCGGYATLVALASRRRLSARTQLAAIIGYVSLPSIIYLIAHFSLPMGAATYITGPPSYLYLFLVILSGFMFSERVALLSGVAAGVQYFVVYLAARCHFAAIQCADPLFMIDLTDGMFHGFKALLMMVSGVAISVLGRKHKDQVGRMLTQEREKEKVDRLFGQFAGPEIRDRILHLQDGAPPERCDAVVLFSDIRSFTTLCEGTAPETVVELLNTYLNRVEPVINRHGGVVDKYIGDAVMATFGAVVAIPDPAAAAVRTALAMLDELEMLNREFVQRGLPALAIGIGIHRGPLILGVIGTSHRSELAVIGDTVNTASRLESLCKAIDSPLVVSAAVHERLPVDLRERLLPRGEHEVKGRQGRVPVFGFPPGSTEKTPSRSSGT